MSHSSEAAESLRVDRYESRDGADGTEWNDAVARLGGSFYHLHEWHGINGGTLGHEVINLTARRDGRIVGLLPLVLVRSRLFGRILCSMPFVNFGGPCAVEPVTDDVLIHAASLLAGKKADYLELRSPRPLAVGLQSSLSKIGMTVPLKPDPNVLWEGFTHKHRKNIKRAYKNDLAVTSGGGEELPAFYRMMEQSWRHLGTPLYSRRYFEDVLAAFPDSTRIFVCRRGKEPIAAALTGYFNGTVEGLWAGGGALARTLDANFVLYWEMIRDACKRGCHSFHLGRSTAHSGGEDFKSRWNAELKQLYWYYYRPNGGEMPALTVSNPKYQLAIKTWRHMPLWCTRRIGPMLARSIP